MFASIDVYASTCDAFHPVPMAPYATEIVRAIALAIERSGRSVEDIGYVSYHGTSTPLNDRVESRCVRQVFRDHADRVVGSAVKSMIGHPQGASGAAGIVTAALAMGREFLPPTINQFNTDPLCDLDYLPNQGRAAAVQAALCNCLGFGSKNSAMVIGRVDS
jgi:3-oxoacyl-[acyl-carrier-protein] synthase II